MGHRSAEQTSWLGDYLRGLRRNNTGGAHRFAWLVEPQTVLATIDVFDLPPDPDQSLAELTGSDGTPADLRPPLVTPIESRGLGAGHRIERSLRVPRTEHETIGPVEEEVMLMAVWAFRTSVADVIVSATHRDPMTLVALLPEVEAFIDAISLPD